MPYASTSADYFTSDLVTMPVSTSTPILSSQVQPHDELVPIT